MTLFTADPGLGMSLSLEQHDLQLPGSHHQALPDLLKALVCCLRPVLGPDRMVSLLPISSGSHSSGCPSEERC